MTQTVLGVLRPRIVIPAMIALALLGFVLVLGRPSSTLPLIARVGPGTIALVVVLTVPYLAARAVVWSQLLRQGGASFGWRPMLAAFSGGEFAKTIPGGIYFENYLLQRSTAVPVSQSLMATVVVSAVEACLAVPAVMLWGIPGWHWLRPTLIGMLFVYIVALVGLWWLGHPSGEAARLRTPRPLARAMAAVREGLRAARPFIALRTLRDNLLPTAASMLVMAFDLLVIGRAIGITQLGFAAALTIFCFTVLALILLPVPTDVGLTEVSGTGALIAFGASPAEAVATFLVWRVLLVASTMAVTGTVMVLLWPGHLISRLSAGQ